jgi:hypothetical protein
VQHAWLSCQNELGPTSKGHGVACTRRLAHELARYLDKDVGGGLEGNPRGGVLTDTLTSLSG